MLSEPRWSEFLVEQEPPKIEFPCDYPIKVMGRDEPGFTELVVSVLRQHAPEVDNDRIAVKNSSGGKFVSVTITIIATGKPQIDALFADLKATGRVIMVL